MSYYPSSIPSSLTKWLNNSTHPIRASIAKQFQTDCCQSHFARIRKVSSSPTNHKNNSNTNRSPYAILKLKTSASIPEIKKAFRKFAKENHPDLNPHIPTHISQGKMSDIIHAYNQLMDDDFYGRVGDGRVALACELYTLNELKMDRIHDVYAIRVNFDDEVDDDSDQGSNISSSSRLEVSNNPIIEINAHPDDSISDIKRQLQSIYHEEWGLDGRRLDRDKLSTGWEIVCRDRYIRESSHNCEGDDGVDGYESIEVMSYHLFLHSYGIVHGDIIHAVVRKYD